MEVDLGEHWLAAGDFLAAGIVLFQALRLVGVGDERRDEPAHPAAVAVVSRRHSLHGRVGQRLGVSEGLVTMMAEDLRRRGYLQAVSDGECEHGCAGCGVASPCKLPGRATGCRCWC